MLVIKKLAGANPEVNHRIIAGDKAHKQGIVTDVTISPKTGVSVLSLSVLSLQKGRMSSKNFHLTTQNPLLSCQLF